MSDPTTERFCVLSDRLCLATGSPGLTSFHGGTVHMTLDEYERLIGYAEATRRLDDEKSLESLQIRTRYTPATGAQGSRITATFVDKVPGAPRSKTIPFPYEARDPHSEAAKALLEVYRPGRSQDYTLEAVSWPERGYVFEATAAR